MGTASGLNGPLSATTADLVNDQLPRGDQVTCTVTASDGTHSTSTTSAPATVRDAPPTATTRITSNAAVGRSPDVTSTLTCLAANAQDPEGSPLSVTYTWRVDNVVRKTETVTGAAQSTLAGMFVKGSVVTCSTTVTDGAATVAGTASVTIGNHVPDCNAQTSGVLLFPSGSVNCYCDSNSALTLDADRDSATTTCAWSTTPGGTPFATGCTLSGATAPTNTTFYCSITLRDASNEGVTRVTTPVFTGDSSQYTDLTVSVSPAALTPNDVDTLLTCNWTPTTISGGITPNYFVLWLINGFPISVGAVKTVPLSRLTTNPQPGDRVACAVTAFAGEEPRYDSPDVVVAALPGEVRSLAASRTGTVRVGDTLGCDATWWTGSATTLLEIQNAAQPTDADGTTLVTQGGGTTLQHVEAVIPASLAGQWVRCRAQSTHSGSPAVNRNRRTEWVYVVGHAPVLDNVAVLPAVSTPCERRVCQVLVSDMDADGGHDVDVTVNVTWLVDGAEVGTDTAAFENLVPGQNALRVPMESAGVSTGSTVRCAASVVKAGLATVSATSADARVTGALAPLISDVAVNSYSRVGEPVTCQVSSSGTCANGDAYVRYTWTVDGVVQPSTGSVFDTTGLTGDQQVACSARAGSNGGGFSAAVESNTARLVAGSWVLLGSSAFDHAGHSVTVVGDLDNDGYAELAIGAPNAAALSRASAGKVYVVRGGTTGGTTQLSNLDTGVGGSVLLGDTGGWIPNDTICRARSASIAVPCNPNRAGFAPRSSADGPLGDGLGMGVLSPGDVDGDGVADLVASAPYAFAQGQYLAGRSYVMSGAVLGQFQVRFASSTILVGDGAVLDGEQGVWQSNLWSLDGANNAWDGHNAGFGLATGDWDGDGTPDVALGAPFTDQDGTGSGRVYQVALGTQTLVGGWLGTLTGTRDITGAPGVQLQGRYLDGTTSNNVLWGEVGGHLSNVGDFDGDGLDDLFVADTGWMATNFLVPGSVDTTSFKLATGSATQVRKLNAVPFSVTTTSAEIPPLGSLVSGKHELFSQGAGVGDINGDGKADLAIPYLEREGADAQVELAIFFGHAGGDLDIHAPDRGENGFVVEGRPGNSDLVGMAKAFGLGDVDGDGLDDVALSLTRNTTPPDHRVYVVYGKADTGALTLAQVQNDMGGFVLTGLAANPWTVAGGDVDGDGLSDILLGMPQATDGARTGNGRVEVWFGRARAGSTTVMGTPAAETLTGTSGADQLVGGHGADVLLGNRGADVLYGGVGDDVLAVSSANFQRVRGGLGRDTLRVIGFELDLSAVRGRVDSVEVIDLAGDLRITRVDALRLSELTNTVRLDGAGTVRVTDAGWSLGTPVMVGTTEYTVLINGKATLVVAPAIDLKVAPRLLSTAFSVRELRAAGTIIGTLTAEDTNGDTVTFSADLSGVASQVALVEPATLTVAGALDHESAPTLEFPVTTTDSDGLSTTATVTVTVTDDFEPPVFAQATVDTSLDENAPAGRTLLVARATDPDEGDTLVYAWVSERQWTGESTFVTDRRAFNVEATTGRVFVRDGTLLDYEFAQRVDLVVRATDSTGRTADVTLQVAITNATLTSSLVTVHFVSQGRSLWSNNVADGVEGATLVEPAHTLDLSTNVEPGDLSLVSPLDSSAEALSGFMGGSISLDVSVVASAGEVNSYLPVDVSFTFPDDIAVGEPFDVDTDWTLNSNATAWGNTPSLQAAIGLRFDAVQALINSPGSNISATNNLNSTDGLNIGFNVQSHAFTGVPFNALFPDGTNLSAPGASDTEAGFPRWVADEQPSTILINPLAPYGQESDFALERVLGGMLLPAGTTQSGYRNADLVLTDLVSEEFLQMRLGPSPVALLAALGIPVQQYSKWQGFMSIPLGNFAKAELTYDLWSQYIDSLAVYHNWMGVQVDAVTGTLTFENGTTLTRSMREGFHGITLPAGADVNNDGRVTFTLALDISATFIRVYNWQLGVNYSSRMLGMSVEMFTKDYDLVNGFPMASNAWVLSRRDAMGPVRTTSTSIFPVAQSKVLRFPLGGFSTIVGTGALQVAQ